MFLAAELISNLGPVELTFSDGSVSLFNVGTDGESLRIDSSAWHDPFQEPLSTENKKFVQASGKLTAFDVSSSPPYDALIGQTVISVDPVAGPLDKIIGVSIATPTRTLHVNIEADDVRVAVA